jgi:L-threonylcarbamoyladenylate synthase
MGRIWLWREAEAEVLLEEAKELINAGQVVALPTETFYALAAHPFQEQALKSLFALKERPPDKPVLLLVSKPEMLSSLVSHIPKAAGALIKAFWPGPLTLVLPARSNLSGWLTAKTGTVGVRQPRQPITCRLIDYLGIPVTGTSANRSGKPPLNGAPEVDREFGDRVPLIVDTGPCAGGLPSAILDLTQDPPRLVRPGAISLASLKEIIPEIHVDTETNV